MTQTTVLLAGNNLTGGITVDWGQRNLSFWSNITITNNSHMCGSVPMWFYTRFGVDGPAAPVAMLNGKVAWPHLHVHKPTY